MTLRLTVIAVALFAASVLLGVYVSARPPTALDVAATQLRGHGVGLAQFFTALGRGFGVAGIIAAAFAIAAVSRASVLPVIVLAIAQILSQATSAIVKLGFHRVRPLPVITYHEPDFSYPSGHAVTAVVLFAGCAILAWHAPVARPVAALMTATLVVCAVGIPWSRLALGAHYATDVVGGLLLGAAWLCAAFAVAGRFGVIAPR